MASAGERAYVFAKACGIVSKSWIGRRAATLRGISRLAELDRLVFSTGARELPEKELLGDLEARLLTRSVNAALSLLGSYARPPEILIRLVKVYEYAELKSLVALKRRGFPSAPPSHADIGAFGAIRYQAWPDLAGMLAGTEYAFIIDRRGAFISDEGVSVETALDNDYYAKLWKSLVRLRKRDRAASEKILREEISLRNCVWALRLRTYYEMPPDTVKRHLVAVEGENFSADAEAALELPLDNREAWLRWKRLAFLNDDSAAWKADPRYFQNSASLYLYRLALRGMRLHALSIDAAFCFIKLKQFEEDLLTSYAEGLSLGMSGDDVARMLEAGA
ncbi:MAG: V-type ATPase subunit [Treponema sp.]|jgi:hypothetical protein|nr:V-type ATPase subunit [Treponema sp.]